MIEEWKVYKDTSYNSQGALWEVSTLGRVKKNGQLYNPYINHNGYCCIASCYLHRIVYELFIGQIPKELEIDHINAIKTDNSISNLRLVTKSQNQRNPLTVARKSSSMKGKLAGSKNPNYHSNRKRVYNLDGTYKYIMN